MESDLNACRAPLNKVNKLSFAYPLQTFMNLITEKANIKMQQHWKTLQKKKRSHIEIPDSSTVYNRKFYSKNTNKDLDASNTNWRQWFFFFSFLVNSDVWESITYGSQKDIWICRHVTSLNNIIISIFWLVSYKRTWWGLNTRPNPRTYKVCWLS